MRLKPIAAALAAGSIVCFATTGAFSQTPPTNPIIFDADGQAATNGDRQVQTFDWAVSSLLSKSGPCPSNPDGTLQVGCNNTIPIFDLVNPSYLKSITHAALQGFQNANGDPAGAPAGLNTTFEITFVAGACVKAQPQGSIDLPAPLPDAPKVLNLTLNPSSGCIVAGKDPLDNTKNASGQFFEIWYDDFTVGQQSDALTGTGYRDGKLILSGSVIDLTGISTLKDDPLTLNAVFDQYINNDYPGILTTIQEGSDTIVVQINALDKNFFRSGVDINSLLAFTGQVKLPYNQTNPSANFYKGSNPVSVGTTTILAPDEPADIGPTNGVNGPDFEQQADSSNSFVFLNPLEACRVTGGGNDTAGLTLASDGTVLEGWDKTVAADRLTPSTRLKPRGKKLNAAAITSYYDYSFGGQAGANTALQPQPKGQWEHNNHSSPTGLTFAFHGGKNAPDGTQIDEIRCTDPGWCVQARPAPDKQIDFVGIGTFSNVKGLENLPLNPDGTLKDGGDGVVFEGIQRILAEPGTGQPGQPVPTYHWFQVHIEDLGEPGSQKGLSDLDDPTACPKTGSGNDPFANPAVTDEIADCDCRDFYRITIYKGNKPKLDGNGDVVLDATGDPIVVDETGVEVPMNMTDKIYEVYGYIEGGNFQIHPLTGFDLK